MRIVIFAHSVASDWNHGNAHFVRGLMRALRERGHEVVAWERWKNWSTENLLEDHGHGPLLAFARRFPDLEVRVYGGWGRVLMDVERATEGADLVLVHEFNEPALVGAVGRVRRKRGDFVLLFHDTHHRTVTAPWQIEQLNLADYDGILAFGESLACRWREDFGRSRVWTFQEAADLTTFYPRSAEPTDDVVWIGNWGDEERSEELRAYLLDSARALPDLRFAVYGVRYPEAARREIRRAGIDFRGWIPNYRVPEAFARAKLTLHIPRRPYVTELPGIPTIRPFEALACGIPMITSPWEDTEGLFRRGEDYLVAESPEALRAHIRRLCCDPEARARIARSGLERIRERHTCEHRARRLESIYEEAIAA